jgi:hypothetical protein
LRSVLNDPLIACSPFFFWGRLGGDRSRDGSRYQQDCVNISSISQTCKKDGKYKVTIIRILSIVDDVTTECLGAIPDTSISGRRVAQELSSSDAASQE